MARQSTNHTAENNAGPSNAHRSPNQGQDLNQAVLQADTNGGVSSLVNVSFHSTEELQRIITSPPANGPRQSGNEEANRAFEAGLRVLDQNRASMLHAWFYAPPSTTGSEWAAGDPNANSKKQ